MTTPVAAPTPDWEQVERDYRAGKKTLRVIAAENGVTHGAVNKRARKEKWVRDLAPKIAARAKELVSKAVAKTVSNSVSKGRRMADVTVVEANASVLADATIKQQEVSTNAVALADSLLKDALAVSDKKEELAAVAKSILDSGGDEKLAETVLKAVSLFGRASAAEKVMKTVVSAVELQRKVWRMDETVGPEDPVEKMSREELEAVFLGMLDRAKIINGEAVHV